LPAASLSSVFWPVGVISGSGWAPFGTRSTVWNDVGTNFTLSPTWIVVVLGKYALASELYFWLNAFSSFAGIPM
jgi:hypothetical protein